MIYRHQRTSRLPLLANANHRAFNVDHSDQRGRIVLYIAWADVQPEYVDPVTPSGLIPLYVGISQDVGSRVLEHAESKEWWLRLVDGVDAAAAPQDRDAAAGYEMEVVASLRPVFNVVGQPGLPTSDRWISEANLGIRRVNALSLVARRDEMMTWGLDRPGPTPEEYLRRFAGDRASST